MNNITYSVRISPRARRVNLTMSAAGGLVVVVPKGYDVRGIPALLALDENRRWIERAAARLEAALPVPLEGVDSSRPQTILLPGIGEAWFVEYADDRAAGAGGCSPEAHDGGRRVISLRECRGGRLRLSGVTADAGACRSLLDRWLRRKARHHLVPWLAALSAELGLPFAGVTIRAQRSRWGSCSSRKTISLNCRLLFLAPELVRYVLVHELCHTVHPNHSAAFWRLVARYEPGFWERRGALRAAARYMPGWLTAGDGRS